MNNTRIAGIALTVACASLITSPAYGSPAAEGPHIVSNEKYSQSGAPDPKSIAATGEESAASESDKKFVESSISVTGLRIAGEPTVTPYETVGEVLSFVLENDQGNQHVDVTRLKVTGDIPESLIGGVGDQKTIRHLAGGATLATAAGPDGNTAAILQKNGQLTVWSSLKDSGLSTTTLAGWAEKAGSVQAVKGEPSDFKVSPVSPAPGSTTARPTCWLNRG